MELAEKKSSSMKRSLLPVRVELLLLMVGIVAVVAFGIMMMMQVNVMLVFALAAGLVGIATVWLGGTRVCLPLYLALAFGEALPLPGAPGSVSVNQCLALAVLAAFVVDLLRYGGAVRFRLAQNILIVFGIYVVVAAVILKPEKTEYPIQQAYYMFLAVVIAALCWRQRWMNALLGGIVVLGMLLLVVPGYAEFVTGKDFHLNGRVTESFRISGFAKDSIIFAGVCVWLLFFAMYLAFSARMVHSRVFFAMCVPLIAVVPLLTFNRQTPIVIALCTAVMLVFMRSRHKWKMAAVMVVAGAAAAPFFIGRVLERFSKAKSVMMDYSLIERHDKLNMAWEMFHSHRIFGVGSGAYKHLWPEYIPKGNMYLLHDYPRNRELYIDMGYMQILTEYGIVGALLVLAFFIASFVLFVRAYRMSRRLEDTSYSNLLAMCAALFAQLLISLFVRDAFLTPQSFVVFGIFFAACTGVERAVAAQVTTEETRVSANAECPA